MYEEYAERRSSEYQCGPRLKPTLQSREQWNLCMADLEYLIQPWLLHDGVEEARGCGDVQGCGNRWICEEPVTPA